MSTYRRQAEQKLEAGSKNGKFLQKAGLMKGLIGDVMKNLCADEEFAQAVVQGGSFEDCMKAVAQGVGSFISDLDAITRAVTFYFPGAAVHYDIRLDLTGQAGADAAPEKAGAEDRTGPAVLRLEDFWR